MKTITTTLALILGLTIGAVAGHFHGKAEVLQSLVMSTTNNLPLPSPTNAR